MSDRSLVGQAFRYYLPSSKLIFPIILLMAVVKDLYIYLGGLPENNWLQLIIIFVMLLLQVYLSSTALLAVNSILLATPMRLNTAFRTIYKRIATIFLGFFAVILVLCAIYFIGHLLANLVVYFVPGVFWVHALSLFLLIGVPLTIALVLFFFIIPILALGTDNIQTAFKESILLVGYKNWLKTFCLYAASAFFLFIISSGTKHGQWLMHHHLNWIFDIVVFSLLLPLLLSAILLFLKSFRLR